MRYWALQAVELCDAIDDESLEEVKEGLLDSIERMGKDRRVVMLGASRSGKSQLLAGMVGSPVLAQVLPAELYIRWRYMNNDGDDSHCRFLLPWSRLHPRRNLRRYPPLSTRILLPENCHNPCLLNVFLYGQSKRAWL